MTDPVEEEGSRPGEFQFPVDRADTIEDVAGLRLDQTASGPEKAPSTGADHPTASATSRRVERVVEAGRALTGRRVPGEYSAVARWVVPLLAALVVSELLILVGLAGLGMSLHGIVLLITLWVIANDPEYPPVYGGIIYAPLLRLLNLGSGLVDISPLIWLFGVYTLVLGSAFFVLRAAEVDVTELGLRPTGTWGRWALLGVSGVPVGVCLGWVQWTFNLEQPPVPPTPVNILELVLVTGVLVGVTEELLFRGMMQRWLSSLVGQPASILYVSILFGSMHSIWFNPGDVMFAFAVSLLLGWSYARTRNFWFITVVHGMINVTAFVVLPVLGG